MLHPAVCGSIAALPPALANVHDMMPRGVRGHRFWVQLSHCRLCRAAAHCSTWPGVVAPAPTPLSQRYHLCCHQSPGPRLCSSIPSPTQLHTSCARGRLCCTAWRGITRGIACRLQHLASVLAVNTALICRLCLPCSRVVLQAYIPLADPPATSDDSRLHDVPQRAGSEPRPNKVQ